MKQLTAEWVRKAESDYKLAVRSAAAKEAFHDQVCFLCQQSAEKYLKALLKEASVKISRTHELTSLLPLLAPYYRLRSLRRGLEFLTQFAVETRYPGKSASKRQATAALRWAGKVRDACRTSLKL